jgi:hypothetical protein
MYVNQSGSLLLIHKSSQLLSLSQREVLSSKHQKLRMSALFYNPTFVKHVYRIGILNRTESMCNGDGGAVFRGLFQRSADQFF